MGCPHGCPQCSALQTACTQRGGKVLWVQGLVPLHVAMPPGNVEPGDTTGPTFLPPRWHLGTHLLQPAPPRALFGPTEGADHPWVHPATWCQHPPRPAGRWHHHAAGSWTPAHGLGTGWVQDCSPKILGGRCSPLPPTGAPTAFTHPCCEGRWCGRGWGRGKSRGAPG